MVTDDRFSDFVDPLENYSGLSLFPKTFEVFHASNSDDLDGQLQAIHNHLKSLALRSPDKLREQAKKILDGNSKSLNTKTTSDPAPMGKNEALPALPKVNPRERRPALNLKRARFSLKPNSSHPAVSSEPALDLKKLKNPEEFFMAYERHENAKREILKQIGGNLSDSEQQNTSLIERPRRPGMPGHDKRRSIKYKHLYSCEDSETGKNVPSSQERNDSSILSPIYHSSQEETERGFTSQETELVGSISKEDHKVDEILDQLLSYNCEDLDGDGALNILQEHLQIKPVELENLQLPDFQEIPKIDLKSSRSGKLPMRSRVLLDVENILKGLSSKTPTKHGLGAESPFSYGASPTPPKSPFASFLLLHQEILRSSLSNDRFSAHDIDQPVRSSSFIESINKEIDFADERRQSEETIFEKDDNVEVAVIDTSKQDGALNVGSSASHVPVDDNIMNNDMVNSVMNDRACEHDANGDAQANRTNVKDKVEDAVQEALLPAQSGLEMMDLALDNSNKQSHLGLGAESPFSYGASPTPPKSPFASFLLLNQKILRSSLSNDRFSAHDIDQPVRSSSFIESINKEIDFAGERRQSEETIFEKDDNVEVAMTDTSKQDGALNVGSSASYVPVDDNIMNNDMDNSVMNDRACEHDANGDAQANRTNVEDKVQVEDAVQETLLPAQSGLEMMDLALDNSNKQSHLDESSTASIHDQAETNAEISDNDSEQDYEMEEEHPNMPLDKNHKANRTNVEDKVQVEDAVQETLLPAQSGLEMMDITLDNSNKQSHLDGPSTASIHDQAERNPKIPDNDSEQDSEIEEEHPNMPLDKNHKANRTNVEDKVQVEDAVQETLLPAQSGLEMMDLALDNSNKQSHLDESSTASIHDQAETNAEISDNDSEQDYEMEEEHPNMPLDKNHKANRTNVEDKVQVEDAVQETLLPAQSGLEMMDITLDNSNKQSHLDGPSTASIHDQADRNPKIPDNDSEQDSEMEEEHPNMPLDKNHKATTQSQKSRKRRKSERKSLGGAGTHWESGVRRSTRIRCRPLEHWKGERLLYGRIHRTLPTVIGLKYASPGKGNGALSLKSYVSAEHQDLVELAGLH